MGAVAHRIDEVALPLKRESLPCGNTYQNVCNGIDLDKLNERLADFFTPPMPAELIEEEAVPVEEEIQTPAPRLKHWVLDGKTLCRSHRPSQGKPLQRATPPLASRTECKTGRTRPRMPVRTFPAHQLPIE